MTLAIRLSERSAEATQFIGAENAFRAFCEACSTYPEMAFRIMSGGTVDAFRLQGWNVTHSTVGRTWWLVGECAHDFRAGRDGTRICVHCAEEEQ